MTVNSANITNLQGLNDLKVTAKKNQREALPEVAKQFEAIFLQSMLKSMRQAGESFKADDLFKSKDNDLFNDMLDQQTALNMADERGIGLAQALIKQIERNLPGQQRIEVAKIEQNGKVLPSLPVEKSEQKPTSLHDGVFDDAKDFVKTLWPHAVDVAQKVGLNPKMLIAQAALETGWGKFVALDSQGDSSNNLFNIKAGKKDSLTSLDVNTKEFIGGEFRKVVASFRKYDDLGQSFNDYAKLVSNSSRYQTAFDNAHNPELYMHQLHKAGYATDPQYADKVLSIYNGGELKSILQELEVN